MNTPARALPSGILPGQPLTALAPMQDVTDLPFMRVMAHYGAPDYFFTEFFRVHAQSRPEKHIVRSIVENKTGRPVFAQLIGEDQRQRAVGALAELRLGQRDTHGVVGQDLEPGGKLGLAEGGAGRTRRGLGANPGRQANAEPETRRDLAREADDPAPGHGPGDRAVVAGLVHYGRVHLSGGRGKRPGSPGIGRGLGTGVSI